MAISDPCFISAVVFKKGQLQKMQAFTKVKVCFISITITLNLGVERFCIGTMADFLLHSEV